MSTTSNQTNASSTPQKSTQNRLRDLIFNNSGKILVAPGVYDGFSARIALEVGFDALYMVNTSK